MLYKLVLLYHDDDFIFHIFLLGLNELVVEKNVHSHHCFFYFSANYSKYLFRVCFWSRSLVNVFCIVVIKCGNVKYYFLL